MKIGIVGGTFNPIHIGHLILAEEVKEKLQLCKVIFVPTYIPPHKDASDIASAQERYKMIKLSIKENKFFSVSDIEIKRRGFSYTIDTVKEFKKIYPGDELYFITGSDLVSYLESWKDINEISKLLKFIVASRPGYPLENMPSYITTVTIRAVDISAYEIRKCIKENRSFRYLVSDNVFKYINKSNLYR